jgi:uncharacterized protein (TIGR00369 family)
VTEPFEPRHPAFETRVRASFERQRLMATIGARLARVTPGAVEIEAPVKEGLSQQHGYVHAGVLTALMDSACGYSALSLLPPGMEVLSVEYKVNFLSPAVGERFVARGRVERPGKQITVCSGEIVALTGSEEKRVAVMLATMVAVETTAG